MVDKGGSDLKKELNALWKSTVDQLDDLKDVIVKSSQAGKARLDEAVLARNRDEKLKELGELVLKADDAVPFPEAWQEKIAEIRGIEEQIASQREEFDTLVKDVKSSIPDMGAATSTKTNVPEKDSETGAAADEEGAGDEDG